MTKQGGVALRQQQEDICVLHSKNICINKYFESEKSFAYMRNERELREKGTRVSASLFACNNDVELYTLA